MGFREGETRIEEQYQLQRQRRRSQANIGTRKPINEEYTAPAKRFSVKTCASWIKLMVAARQLLTEILGSYDD